MRFVLRLEGAGAREMRPRGGIQLLSDGRSDLGLAQSSSSETSPCRLMARSTARPAYRPVGS